MTVQFSEMSFHRLKWQLSLLYGDKSIIRNAFSRYPIYEHNDDLNCKLKQLHDALVIK